MSLRIASLDPNVPKAAKDCRICNRRRIRCDRSLPSCKKCGQRSLECSGYDLKLKWDQGVASRGKFAGKAIPVISGPPPVKRDIASLSEGPVIAATDLSTRQSSCGKPTSSKDVTAAPLAKSLTLSNGSAALFSPRNDNITPTRHQYGIDLSLSWLSLPTILRSAEARQLLHYYDHSLAPTLVWVDSSENPWRNQMLPLAMESPTVLYSILALAAEHLSRLVGRSQPISDRSPTTAGSYRDKGLKLLAQHLRNERQAGDSDARSSGQSTVNSILATMLILCQLEMVKSDSGMWLVHLQASRTMIQRWLLTPSSADLSDPTSRFLMNEIFIINVFASTSRFGEDGGLLGLGPQQEGTLFSEYVRIIHDITTAERRRSAIPNGYEPTYNAEDLVTLQRRLEDARECTQRFSHRIGLCTESLRRDFNRLVGMHHHAGLIYAYQALAEPTAVAPKIAPLLDLLFEDLRLLPATGVLAQNLAWPLFIAGTECRGQAQKQQWVEAIMFESMKSTGFSSCQQALDFLRLFWAEDGGQTSNWIRFARAYGERGHTFLVY